MILIHATPGYSNPGEDDSRILSRFEATGKRATVCSADHDFARFTGIKHVNPLVG